MTGPGSGKDECDGPRPAAVPAAAEVAILRIEDLDDEILSRIAALRMRRRQAKRSELPEE